MAGRLILAVVSLSKSGSMSSAILTDTVGVAASDCRPIHNLHVSP